MLEKSKTARLATYLARFESGSFSISGLARTFHLSEATVRNLAYINPAQMSTKGDSLNKLDVGGASATGHNTRIEGQPSTLRAEPRSRPKRSASTQKHAHWLSGGR